MRSNFVSALLGCGLLVSFAASCDSPGKGGGVTPTTKADVSGSDVVTTGTCTQGVKRCNGQTAQQCQSGQFVDLFTCPAEETCENGVCKSGASDVQTTTGDVSIGRDTGPDTSCSCVGHECGSDGCGGTCGTCTGNTHCENFQCVTGTTTCTPKCDGKTCGPDGCGGQCGNCHSGETCQSGQFVGGQQCSCNGAVCGLDNCGNNCGNCSGGKSCQDGQCVTNESGDTCQQILDCVTDPNGCGKITDPTAFSTCAQACVDKGSTTGQSEFSDYLGCLQACPQNDDGTCALQNCLSYEAACHFQKTGTQGCAGIQTCLQGCASGDTTCIFGCYETGDPQSQEAFLGLVECMNIECGASNPNPDPNCNSQTDLPAACVQYVQQCN